MKYKKEIIHKVIDEINKQTYIGDKKKNRQLYKIAAKESKKGNFAHFIDLLGINLIGIIILFSFLKYWGILIWGGIMLSSKLFRKRQRHFFYKKS